MEKWSDKSRCVKCGNTRATSEYINGVSSCGGYPILTNEVIKRKCTNCGYSWDELPIDHIEEVENDRT